MGKKLDLLGKKFGSLTVIEFAGKDKFRASLWKCSCECGKFNCSKELNICRASLLSGRTLSCGNGSSKTRQSENVPVRRLYNNYRHNAMKRNYCWELNLELFEQLTNSKCHYCGMKPYKLYRPKECNHIHFYNGIDRKDNSIGYTEENSVPCCEFCNYAKGGRSMEKFMKWINHVRRIHTA